jgi:MFS family permease
MDFDQMLETWHTQNTAPPYEVNRAALQQTLQAEEARVREVQRRRRRMLWICWIIGTGMAIFAGFWIAISITNRWPAIYAIAAGLSLGMFALGIGALWMGRGREAKRNYGNTLEEEVRRSLALIDYQLSVTKRWISVMLGAASIFFGAMLLFWTVNTSQGINDSTFPIVLPIVIFVWAAYKERDEMRMAKPKLELRQQHLRELLAALDSRE